MKLQLILCLLCINFLLAHEGHQNFKNNQTKQEVIVESQHHVHPSGGRPISWTQWIGGFHFIFLHFPIALIMMTTFSELLFAWNKRMIFEFASRFMLISAAVLSIPTVILGLTYSYTTSYSGVLAQFIWWHQWLGISTAFFAIFVACIRGFKGTSKLYYLSLFFLFLLVNITGYLGGGMTFGPYHMYPP